MHTPSMREAPAPTSRSRPSLLLLLLMAGAAFAPAGALADPPPAPAPATAEATDVWYVIHLGDRKIGHMHRTQRPSEDAGRTGWRTTEAGVFVLSRGSMRMEIVHSSEVVEDAEGRVVRFRSLQSTNMQEQVTEGRVEGDTLHLVRLGRPLDVPYPEGVLGPRAASAAGMARIAEGATTFTIPAFNVEAPDQVDNVRHRVEAYVREKIVEKNFGVGFATAAEVARRLEGDCTEHGVLAAGLARAAGLPARVVVGLAYLPPEEGVEALQPHGAFGYHMWTEVLVGEDFWLPIDAAIGAFDATHIAIAKDALACASPGHALTLAALEVMGTLAIEVLEP